MSDDPPRSSAISYFVGWILLVSTLALFGTIVMMCGVPDLTADPSMIALGAIATWRYTWAAINLGALCISVCGAPSTWHLQIDGTRDGLSDAPRYAGLCCHGDADDLGPGGEGLGAAGPEVCGGVVVSAAGEKVGDLVMRGKEALDLPRRLEPLHDPLSSSGRLMGVFGPVVEALCAAGARRRA